VVLRLRLSPKDIQAILKGLSEVPELGSNYDLLLFGSRVDSAKLGGDIDLLVIVPEEILKPLQAKRHLLVSMAKKYITDQRLDITLRSLESLDSDPFYQSIKNGLVKLK
jgi:predicted nucleotidyltransferase